jgi:transcriptional regulator GlxA family with amidase domain
MNPLPTTRQLAEGRAKDKGGRTRRRAVYEEALAVIERSYADQRLSVDGLSHKVFVSRRQLQRAFTEAGTSVQEQLHAVRMRHAAELLRDTALPVSEITRCVGYRHSAQFAKAFRRRYGLAPTQWRKEVARQAEPRFPAAGAIGRLSTA